jgi:hypothetical protein
MQGPLTVGLAHVGHQKTSKQVGLGQHKRRVIYLEAHLVHTTMIIEVAKNSKKGQLQVET